MRHVFISETVLVAIARASQERAETATSDLPRWALALDDLRVRCRLATAEAALRRARPADLAEPARSRRAAILDHVAQYRWCAVFPRRSDRERAIHRPLLVDRDGRPCVVAALLRAHGGALVLRHLVERWPRRSLADIASAPLAAWAAAHGLRVAELARLEQRFCRRRVRGAGDAWAACAAVVARATAAVAVEGWRRVREHVCGMFAPRSSYEKTDATRSRATR